MTVDRSEIIDAPFVTREYLEERLRAAGIVLVSLPSRRGPDDARCAWPDIVRSAFEAYGWTAERNSFPVPSGRAVMEMGEVLDWVLLLTGQERYIVSARMLWHPLKDRPIISWRRLARKTHMHRDTVQRYYDVALDRLVGRINTNKDDLPLA